MIEPLIINACLTGMVPTKENTPFIPLTSKEIVSDAKEVIDLGASMIHLHVRDTDGTPTYKKSLYEKIILPIRQYNRDVILVVSTSGRKYSDFTYRSEALELTGQSKPDFASLTLGSMNFPNTAVSNSPEMIRMLAEKMQKNNIYPEWEVFEPGMLNYGLYLVKHKIVPPPRWINIFLGNLGTAPATESMLQFILNMLPKNWRWSATGVGKFQLPINLLAIKLNGHIRVGMEDNWYMDDDKKILATNALLVKRMVLTAKNMGRQIATAKQARNLLMN